MPQGVDLLLEGLVDLRMAVADADRDDPAEHVQVAITVVVPKPLHAAL